MRVEGQSVTVSVTMTHVWELYRDGRGGRKLVCLAQVSNHERPVVARGPYALTYYGGDGANVWLVREAEALPFGFAWPPIPAEYLEVVP